MTPNCDGAATNTKFFLCQTLTDLPPPEKINNFRLTPYTSPFIALFLLFSFNTNFRYIQFIKQAERLDGFMREAQMQRKLLGAINLRLSSSKERDDSASKNIIQMKTVSKKMFQKQ